MAKSYDEDDLFKHTSMTFGEHLEELRASLFKAVLSLGIGFCIGLYFAPDIVHLIQSPLERALKNYYTEEALEYINARLPPEKQHDPAVEKMVIDDGLIPQEAFIEPRELLQQLRAKYPKTFTGIDLPQQSAPTEKNPSDAAAEGKPALTKPELIQTFLWRRLSDDERIKLKAFNVQEGFMIWIKAALLFGALISSPFVFYFLWSFVAAGLYPHEKKYVHTFLPVSVGLFACGALLAFTFVFPPVLQFFFSINKSMGQALEPRISEWLGFVLLLPLGFGISFQLPLLMLFLERIHIFNVQFYLAKWRIAVLIMAVAAMVLSPGGDPYSMMMMLVPLIGLYFAGIALCKWLPSNRQRAAAPEESSAYANVD
jgi:sec-independent protein translocase protein TatC